MVTHRSSEKNPERIHTIQTLTKVGCRFARFETRKVVARTGRRMVFTTKLKYIHTLSRALSLLDTVSEATPARVATVRRIRGIRLGTY